MLLVVRRGGEATNVALSAEHDALLRAAFGRTGSMNARSAAAAIVNEHHAAGHWFACDCLGDKRKRPILVPVLGSFVRRQASGQWPDHAPWCDFFREAAEQTAVSASYGRDAPIGLVRAFVGEASRVRRSVVHAGPEHRRSRLARLLFRLLDDSSLNTATVGRVRSLRGQLGVVRKAATAIELEDRIPVSSVLLLDPPLLGEFCHRIASIPAGAFRRTGNPHGVMIAAARSAANGVIEPVEGAPFPVVGEIAMFGEIDGRGARARDGVRGPYVMACLVGRRAPSSKVEVLRAYLHPCMGERWMFPVDSNLERLTMRQLLSVAHWLEYQRCLPTIIRKPVWDLAAAPAGASYTGEAHEPIIPDFIVEIGIGAERRRAVAETMGYAEAAYRARKQRLRPEMERLAGGRVIEHDFHAPSQWDQEARDRAFWFALRDALMPYGGPNSR